MARDQRRLAAIVSADVAGYSRLMGQDDSRTLAALKAHRRELMDPKIAEYDGRIVKTTGDGLLLEFPSVVEAVRCAVDVQRGMAERNAGVSAEQRIEFRIGINVGDIIIDGDDIYGDGVNVAARLQTLAEPGGICASRVVRDQVLDKLSFTFEGLGAQQVKNIARPVEVYRVDLGSGASPAQGRGRRRWKRLTQAVESRWLVASVAALGIAGVAAWAVLHFWKAEPISAPPPLSVAILPFAASESSSDDEQFAAVFTQDLTQTLGQEFRAARVMSYSLAARYKGTSTDVRKIGNELNVRYVVEGGIRRAGGRTVVSAQLIDAGNGTQTWSDHVELEQMRGGQDSRDDLAVRLSQRLHRALLEAEYRRNDAKPATSASAMELTLSAVKILNTGSDSLPAVFEARKLFDEALQRDPTLLTAILGRGFTLLLQIEIDPLGNNDQVLQELVVLSERAIAVGRDDQRAWQLRAAALYLQGRLEGALEAIAEAQRLDPTQANPVLIRAGVMIAMGQPAEALKLVDKAFALDPQFDRDPQGPGEASLKQCVAFVRLGHYDEAIAACEKAEAQHDSWRVHLYLIAAYAQNGDTAKAAAEKAKLLKRRPGYSIAEFRAENRNIGVPTYWQQTETYLFAGLRKAGIPEE